MPPEATLQRVSRALRELRLKHVAGEPPSGELCEVFEPADPGSLAGAIMRARHAGGDPAAAARVLRAHARAQAVS